MTADVIAALAVAAPARDTRTAPRDTDAAAPSAASCAAATADGAQPSPDDGMLTNADLASVDVLLNPVPRAPCVHGRRTTLCPHCLGALRPVDDAVPPVLELPREEREERPVVERIDVDIPTGDAAARDAALDRLDATITELARFVPTGHGVHRASMRRAVDDLRASRWQFAFAHDSETARLAAEGA